ncbi:MAG TPA: hypothetical protein VER96_29440 [Polyangiaceae bacterium]|nr:hypothetical protein [Polyangiaceae bacterium]
MLLPAVILALSQASVSPEVRTLSSNDNTDELAESVRVPRPPVSEFERRFTLELRLGVATPTGALGVGGEFAFVPRLGVGCGVGTNAYGPEYGCWLRARPILGRSRALSLSTGLSTAPFRQTDASAGGVFGWGTGAMSSTRESPDPPDRVWAHAYWLNTDVGYESRRESLLFRVFGGVAALLNPNDGVVEPATQPDTPRAEAPVSALIYAGIGLGFYE